VLLAVSHLVRRDRLVPAGGLHGDAYQVLPAGAHDLDRGPGRLRYRPRLREGVQPVRLDRVAAGRRLVRRLADDRAVVDQPLLDVQRDVAGDPRLAGARVEDAALAGVLVELHHVRDVGREPLPERGVAQVPRVARRRDGTGVLRRGPGEGGADPAVAADVQPVGRTRPLGAPGQ